MPSWGMEPFPTPPVLQSRAQGGIWLCWGDPWHPSLAGLGGSQRQRPSQPVPELLVLTDPLWFDLQALWGWQQLLPWQRGRNGSDRTCSSPTPPFGRGSRHVCSGEHSPVPATSVSCSQPCCPVWSHLVLPRSRPARGFFWGCLPGTQELCFSLR